MEKIELFTNELYLILSFLYDNKGKDNLVRITQTEISEVLDVYRGRVNSHFKTLIENGYLIQEKGRNGKYYLTNQGVKTVEIFRKANNIKDW